MVNGGANVNVMSKIVAKANSAIKQFYDDISNKRIKFDQIQDNLSGIKNAAAALNDHLDQIEASLPEGSVIRAEFEELRRSLGEMSQNHIIASNKVRDYISELEQQGREVPDSLRDFRTAVVPLYEPQSAEHRVESDRISGEISDRYGQINQLTIEQNQGRGNNDARIRQLQQEIEDLKRQQSEIPTRGGIVGTTNPYTGKTYLHGYDSTEPRKTTQMKNTGVIVDAFSKVFKNTFANIQKTSEVDVRSLEAANRSIFRRIGRYLPSVDYFAEKQHEYKIGVQGTLFSRGVMPSDVTEEEKSAGLTKEEKINRQIAEARKAWVAQSGDLEQGAQDIMVKYLAPILGEKEASERVQTSFNEVVDKKTGEVFATFDVQAKITTEDLTELGLSADAAQQRIKEIADELQRLMNTRVGSSIVERRGEDGSIIRGASSPYIQQTRTGRRDIRSGLMGKLQGQLSDKSWKVTSLSMTTMGVYFSLMGVFMGLQSVINRLTSSLSDLSSMFKNYAYVKAFGGQALNANKILEKFGQTTGSLVTGWKKLTAVQSAFSLGMSAMAASIFNNEALMNKISDAINKLFDSLSKPEVLDTFIGLFSALADNIPAIIDAMVKFVEVIGAIISNPLAVKILLFGYAFSMIIQPILTAVAGLMMMSQILPFTIITMEALGVSAGVAAGGLAAMAVGMVEMVAVAILAAAAWEALGRAIEFVASNIFGMKGAWIPKPSDILGATFQLGGWMMDERTLGGSPTDDLQHFAIGDDAGPVKSEGYDMVPNHPDSVIITAKPGETVRTKEQESDLQKQLRGRDVKSLQHFDKGFTDAIAVAQPMIQSSSVSNAAGGSLVGSTLKNLLPIVDSDKRINIYPK